jgi:outer membrane protein insertion porin family
LLVSTLSCLETKYLQSGEYFLADQRIKGNKKNYSKALLATLKQDCNFASSSLPISVWIYQIGKSTHNPDNINKEIKAIQQKFEDKIANAANNPKKAASLEKIKKKRIDQKEMLLNKGNLMMRLGSKPVIYNESQVSINQKSLLSYLKYNGYFEAKVEPKVKLRNQKAYVTYNISENTPYTIAKIKYEILDPELKNILKDDQINSLIKIGEIYKSNNLSKERNRIYELLTNKGYYGFDIANISFEVTLLENNKQVEITFIINTEKSQNPKYFTNEIFFLNHQSNSSPTLKYNNVKLGDVTFISNYPADTLNLLLNKIIIKKGEVYNAQKTSETLKKLYELSIFRDINITHKPTEGQETQLNLYINTYEGKKVQADAKFELENTADTIIFKTDIDLSLKNIFKKLRILTISADLAIEDIIGFLSMKKALVSYNLKLINTVPYAYLPFNLVKLTKFYKYNIKTDYLLNYDTKKTTNFKNHSFNLALTYIWKVNPRSIYKIDLLSLSFLQFSEVKKDFLEYITNNNLEKSYKSYFLDKISGSYQFIKNPYYNSIYENNFTSIFSFDCVGLLHLDKIVKLKLEYYKYIKLNFSYTKSINLSYNTVFTHKASYGIIYPYSSNKAVPHDSYYFADGANGVRAWGKNTLGPGSLKSNKETATGEIMLQNTIELTQGLSKYLAASAFIDFGNVWMLNGIDKQGNFAAKNFFKEVAIGTGLGIKLIFNIIVINVDLGIKIYDPSKPLGYRFIGNDILKPDAYKFHLRIGQ